MARAVRLAHKCRRAGEDWRIVVSTDSKRYAAMARQAGAETPFLRPRRLATSGARLIDAVIHAMNEMERRAGPFDAVLVLSATTPLTLPSDVRRALTLFRRHRQAVVSVAASPVPPSWLFCLHEGRLVSALGSTLIDRRQKSSTALMLNGAVYVAAPTWLREHHQFFVGGHTVPLLMPKTRSLDIEDAFDLQLAERLASRKQKGLRRSI